MVQAVANTLWFSSSMHCPPFVSHVCGRLAGQCFLFAFPRSKVFSCQKLQNAINFWTDYQILCFRIYVFPILLLIFFSKYKKIEDIKSENIIQNENSIVEKKQQDLPFKYTEEKNILKNLTSFSIRRNF